MGSLERKIKRNALKQHVKNEEKKHNVKGMPFNKYWEQYKKELNKNGRRKNN